MRRLVGDILDYAVLRRAIDRADRVFLNPREVSLKNYIFRTGLNWRFDWGKAPVAVMAKY